MLAHVDEQSEDLGVCVRVGRQQTEQILLSPASSLQPPYVHVRRYRAASKRKLIVSNVFRARIFTRLSLLFFLLHRCQHSMFIRPGTFEACTNLLQLGLANAMQVLEPGTDHFMLWKGYATLVESSYIQDVLHPLYDKNMLVRVGMHALIPMVCEWLTNPEKLNAVIKGANEKDRSAYEAKYLKSLDSLREACASHSKRCESEKITERMIKMRKGIDEQNASQDVQNACKLLYSTTHVFRVIIDLQNERLVESLHEHTDIASSNDIPFSMMGL